MNYSVLTSSNSNNIKFYLRYIGSVNSQIIQPKEIVFVNDGAKLRNIFNILKTKINKNIKLIYIQNFFNLGISNSLNIGLRSCNYNLILRLDIDDIWKKEHSKIMMKNYSSNKNYLIYANASNFYNKGYVDKNLIIDNPSIHSSWMINRRKNKKFKYMFSFPEDYATISYYFTRGNKFKLIKNQTIIYTDNINSFSKKEIANRDLNKIRLKNLKYFIQKYGYLKLFLNYSPFQLTKLVLKIFLKK